MIDQSARRATSKQTLHRNILILAAYFLLTIVMTWPSSLHLGAAIPGDGFDGWQNYWNLWWVKTAILRQGTNPYYTDYLYPPAGTNLFFHTLNIFNGLWTLPLQMNAGLAVAYNSVVFLSFGLSGYGGYLLCLYCLSRLKPVPSQALWPAAFIGGLIFTMSPFHMAHLLGHMQVFSMIWPPFYILWLLRTLKPWTGPPPAGNSWRDMALTTLFLVLATSVDWYHTLYLILFTGLALLWALASRWIGPSEAAGNPSPAWNSRLSVWLAPLGPVVAIGLGFALTLSPILWPMIREARARPDLETGLVQNITLSADLLAFFTPSELHPLWGDWAVTIADNFTTTTSERLIFAGFIPLVLGGLALRRGWSHRPVRFWGLSLAFFFILALGPYLHINGRLVSLGRWPLPMPYLLLYHTVPFMKLTRSLSRYDLMVMLSLGVLAAIGLSQLQARWARSRRTSALLPLLAGLLICFEFLAWPYPLSKIEIPLFYEQIGAEAERYTIAELPMNWDRPTPLLHQTVHQKNLLTAYTSRDNPRELAQRIPVLQQWRYLESDIIDQPLALIAPTIFFDFNLRYIVLDYWQMPPGPERAATEKWVAAALPGLAPIYEDGRLKVYQSPAKGETRPYLSLGQGWGERRSEAGHVRRSITGPTAEVFVHHPQHLPLELGLTVTGLAGTKLTVQVGEIAVARLRPDQVTSDHLIPLPPLTDDLTRLTLSVTGPVTVSRISLESY